MGPTGEVRRVIQIHPTRRCNLRCRHCYSLSGPEERDQLDPGLLRGAITDAALEGYTAVSFSGGEPLLYRPLSDLLRHAHDCGLQTAITTNGMLLDERRLAALQGITDLIAISLDGVPESHNQMRGSDQAFDTMARRLAGVRQAEIPFGFIFTLTQFNLHELEWVAAFALEQDAVLLQVHPLEEVGRAEMLLLGAQPDGIESSYASLEMTRLHGELGTRLHLHFDLAHRKSLCANPERIYAGMRLTNAAGRKLAELVSPLVIEADGCIVPLQYGFARAFALGNLHEAPLAELGMRWRGDAFHRFHELCHHVFATLADGDDPPFVNWYEAMRRQANEMTMGVPVLVSP
jgi:Fe-coproporphyrin III synthase